MGTNLLYRISHIFQTKIEEGDQLQKRHKNPKTYFCAKVAPALSIKKYLLHLVKHLGTPPATLILMMIYVERLLQSLTQALASTGNQYQYLLTSNNAHRIVLSALLMAHKYSIDMGYPFSLLSKMVGVSSEELKILESEFLVFIKFDLYVSPDLYSQYEEIFANWPGLTDQQEEEVEMEVDQTSQATIRKNEEAKEIDDITPVLKKPDNIPTDEDLAMNIYESKFSIIYCADFLGIEQNMPNPASRHEKPVDNSPCPSIQNSDIRSSLYEGDPESGSEDDDTEMTQFGKSFLINALDLSDLGEDEYFNDFFIQTY